MTIFALAVLPIFAADAVGPEYTADGRLKFPEHYREWVFLSTGIGMTYGPIAEQGQWGPPMFDNIFVNPEAYRAFLKMGRWPEKTVLVMEARHSESHASINNGGHFQTDLVGVEAEVKDSSAPEGPWNFYGFNVRSGQPVEGAKAVSHKASCYGCHGVKTAVENTFVQFYPPLYDAAERMGTFNEGFEPLPITPGKLIDRISAGGWRKAVGALDDASKRSPDATIMNLEVLNQTAYRLMGRDVVGDAVALLQWASARSPKSANVQDSLGEACERFGNPWLARTATENAMKLLPDDKTLVAVRRDRIVKGGEERLKRLPPDHTTQVWPKVETHGGAPAVSPDGSRIAFASDRDGSHNLYLVNTDGSGEVAIMQGAGFKSPPRWTAGGRVVFSTWGDGQSRLFAMDRDGANQHLIGVIPTRMPALSPDGRKVVYADGRLYVAATDGSEARPVTTGVALEWGATWSPDGTQIAFVRSGPERKVNLWVMNADGSEQRQVTHMAPEEGNVEAPAWSPDGRRIAVQVGQYSPGRSIAHLWVVEASSGEARKLATHPEPYLDEMPAWFPDGHRLAFQSNRTGRMEVWVMGADGSGARQVTR